ncbi:putative dehydrogenase [Orenia metallireducens]|jgi:predicted dehydrogenase|uniref:Predicted dehydrogenase n=1 Tax=Orenia metallireducens TaxID=1413210 RepID=A0A285G873_9FIRM|nr:Gfo/Idh/MocA family oxidoreductase [Orenia metallireducens]PRX28279.1 putative dehydrogenase [Orenia metallireducens]SNY19543.1 Predicted dehydrogenase [Orenia metallireducens]
MRYAIIGTGSRSSMYYEALVKNEEISKENELVALMDLNQSRMDYVNKTLGLNLPTYQPYQFEEMLETEKIEGIVVTTKDSHHHEYIIKGLKKGLKVITEKPMTTNEEKCQEIIDTMEETGNDLIVTFNYRYSPYRSKVKELIQDGVIGDLTLVEFHWFLDTTHGADYYRRWHGEKRNSGSLWVHKSTHHFDLVNWWLDAKPEEVFAFGEKRFYKPETFQYRLRCKTCDVADDCKFYLDMSSSKKLTGLYLEAEAEDGYFRDRCVFSPEINIWDTRALTVKYDNSALLSYSLNNYAPYEGYKVAFVGTKGRIEQDVIEASYISGHDGKLERRTLDNNVRLEVFPLFAESYEVEVEVSKGGHGGGDIRLLKDIFLDTDQEDPLNRKAGGIDGAMSILTGIAARRSIEKEQLIKINDLVKF